MCWMKPRDLIALSSALVVAVTLTACTADDGPADDNNAPKQGDRVEGQTDFVSANGRNGEASRDNTGNNGSSNVDAGESAAPGAPADDDSGRTVEEGDIYQVMAGQDYVLNLNSYRGLQVIDFSDPADPAIVGRARMTGTPVEMYQVGDRVFALMNNWRGYYGSRDDLLPDEYEGGMVMVVDVSDPQAPTVTGQAQVPGNIRTSRLTRGDDQEALYVVADDWTNGSETYVKSFSVSSQGALEAKTEFGFDGNVGDIQATSERLMVARNNHQTGGSYQTSVTLFDISDPSGAMVEGDTVQVEGTVSNQFNMHIQDEVMRVVSAGNWNGTNTNHLETFDISDISSIVPIDHDTFGDNQDLYATLFLANRAFFVTYFRQDPFHAFAIGDDGQADEKSEFIVSGWNDFFEPVSSNTRLVGIGKNDQNGNTMAVSLYDITDLENPDPLITREEVDLEWSSSEANWDHRAYSVLEKGTNVEAPTGETETGLVLLPFSGWDSDAGEHVSAVQIFTFSDDTLTLRGTMDQGSQVRRSFVTDRHDHTTANLSELELSLFDTSDPDAPEELGRVELAPNFSDFLVFGDHGVRRESRQRYYARADASASDYLEVVPLGGDPDATEEIASIEIPTGSQVFQVDDLLVTVAQTPLENASTDERGYETAIEVWDLSDPTAPEHSASLTSDEIDNGYYGGGYDMPYPECMDCGGYYASAGIEARVVGDALVFVSAHRGEELAGTLYYRYIQPVDANRANCRYQDAPSDCSYMHGSVRCSQLEHTDGRRESEVCYGSIQECTRHEDGEVDCTEVDPDDVDTEVREHESEHYRHWTYYDFQPLDLSDPAAPALASTVSMPEDEDDVSVLAEDGSLFVTYKEETQLAGDSRPYVRYYFKEIDFAQPSNPQVDAPINIPGELLAVDGDTVVTRDLLWGENIVESSINKLELADGLAYLQGSKRFRDRQVEDVMLDGAGNVLVSHEEAWRVRDEPYGGGYYGESDQTAHLSVLDLSGDDFEERAVLEIDRWATLREARAGRALFSVPGGLLVVNLDDPDAPFAQAYFPTRSWPSDILVEGDDLYFAGGLYGMYKFGLDETNLSSE